jgi:hypothetical protein
MNFQKFQFESECSVVNVYFANKTIPHTAGHKKVLLANNARKAEKPQNDTELFFHVRCQSLLFIVGYIFLIPLVFWSNRTCRITNDNSVERDEMIGQVQYLSYSLTPILRGIGAGPHGT